jgi:hypothetical protein
MGLGIEDGCLGVIDTNIFETVGRHPLDIRHAKWGAHDFGHGAWADNPQWGTDQFLFVEDNSFIDTSPKGELVQASDGARVVFRHNVCNNVDITANGTEAQGRGAKQIEEYNNSYAITTSTNKRGGQIRSGSLVTHDNVWTGYTDGHVLQAARLYKPSVHFGPADGENVWDKLAKNPTGGLGYWATGTHTGANGASILTDSNAAKAWWNNAGVVQSGAWGTNRFVEDGVAYMVRNVTQEDPTNFNENFVFAVSNDANNIHCSTLTGNGVHRTFNTGDTYEIWKVTQALDQPGMGKCDLLTGLGTYPGGTTPFSDPHQAQEACYSWNNTLDLFTTEPNIKSTRDYNNATVKPAYTPYTYPHPLTVGGGGGTGSAIEILAPQGNNWGDVPVGMTADRPVNVHNAGDAPFTVSTMEPPTGWTQTGGAVAPFDVAPGLIVGLVFTFTPTQVRNYEGDIIFISDADTGTGILHVRGRGVTPGSGSDGTIDVFQAKYWVAPQQGGGQGGRTREGEVIDYADLDAAAQPIAAFKPDVIGALQLSPTAVSKKMEAIGGPGLLLQYEFPEERTLPAFGPRFNVLLASVEMPGINSGDYVLNGELLDVGGHYVGESVPEIRNMIFFGVATTNKLKIYAWNGDGAVIPRLSRLNFRIFSNP